MKIRFEVDHACPWAYLESTRVESYFAEVGAAIDFRSDTVKSLEAYPRQLRVIEHLRGYGEVEAVQIRLLSRRVARSR